MTTSAMIQLLDSGRYTDIVLCFHDTTLQQSERLRVNAHRSVLFASQIQYFQRLVEHAARQQQTTVVLYVDFSLYTPEMLVAFVRLIYAERVSRRVLGDELAKFLNENLLHFYQLALYFAHDRLLAYCLKRLSQQMCASLFESLTAFCLMPDVGAASASSPTPRFYVPHEKMPLYERMIRWRHHCADKNPSVAAAATDDTEPLLLEHERHVTNFPFSRLPQKRIDRAQQRVTYHRNLCRRCLSAKDTPFYNLYMIKLGRLALSDHSVACEFSLARDKATPDRFALWLKFDSSPSSSTSSSSSGCSGSSSSSDDDHMSVESGGESEQILRTNLSFFSKRVTDESVCAQSSLPLGTFREVLNFPLHDRTHCYEAQCGGCLQRKLVYIMEITVDIVNKPPFV